MTSASLLTCLEIDLSLCQGSGFLYGPVHPLLSGQWLSLWTRASSTPDLQADRMHSECSDNDGHETT